jgi:predicted amidohydrolase
MRESVRVACVQLRAVADVDANLETAERLCERAAGLGAELVVLPEKWPAFGGREELWAAAEEIGPAPGAHAAEGPICGAVSSWARRHGMAIVAGSISERVASDVERLRNTSVAFDADGRLVASYRKLHLFDVDVEGNRFRESDTERPGDEPCLVELAGAAVGLTVCYDLRFPELFRAYALAGAEIVTLPAAFLERTGRDHWEPLLRARAIENGIFVAAASQQGTLGGGFRAYGRSLVCDPWGVVLAQAGDGEGVVVADCARATLERVRREVPVLAHRRPAAYGSVRRVSTRPQQPSPAA